MYMSSCKVPTIIVRFLIKFEFSRQDPKIIIIKYFMQNRSVGFKLFQANLYIEGRTYKLVNMAKLKVAFRSFSKAPKSSAL